MWFGPKPGFVKLQAKVQNYEDDEAKGLSSGEKAEKGMLWIPGAVFLRGGSVGVLVSSFSSSISLFFQSLIMWVFLVVCRFCESSISQLSTRSRSSKFDIEKNHN